eukprot:397781_1
MSHTLIISILENNDSICSICERGFDPNSCNMCSEDTFTLTHEILLLNDTLFDIITESNMIDLRVISPQNITMQYLDKQSKLIDVFPPLPT